MSVKSTIFCVPSYRILYCHSRSSFLMITFIIHCPASVMLPSPIKPGSGYFTPFLWWFGSLRGFSRFTCSFPWVLCWVAESVYSIIGLLFGLQHLFSLHSWGEISYRLLVFSVWCSSSSCKLRVSTLCGPISLFIAA